MKNISSVFFSVLLIAACGISSAQCTIDTANTTVGFTPATPAVIKPGVAYSQTVQVYVPATYDVYTVDSLHIDSATGMPTGITYVLNPASGTVLGGTGGAMCFAGTTFDTVGPYPLTFYGNVYTNGGPIPFSYLVTLDHSFGYKFRVETAPVAAFIADSPVCDYLDTVQFTDLTTGYPTHWVWTFEGGTPATSTSEFPAVVYDSAGTYAVTLIASNSISRDTVTDSITVNPSLTGVTFTSTPAVGSPTSANGSAIATASGGTPPYSYLWSTGAIGDTLSNVVTGSYNATITDARGCQFTNDTVNVSFVNGIIQLTNALQVHIYPNPATDVLNIAFSQKTNADIAIVDLNGKIINTQTAGTANNVLDIHSLASGAYILRITDKVSNQQQSMLFTKF